MLPESLETFQPCLLHLKQEQVSKQSSHELQKSLEQQYFILYIQKKKTVKNITR